MAICKAIINIGPNKGTQCVRPATENDFCGRHQRNYQYQLLINDNKIPCAQFYRGCDNTVIKTGKCKSCLEKIATKVKPFKCEHDGCKFRTKEGKYCSLHLRDLILDEGKEKGVKYCDVARGCYIVLDDNYAKCENCRKRASTNEKLLREKRNNMHLVLSQDKNTENQLCVNCGKSYEKFLTTRNKESKICRHCNENNVKQDKKRENRVRNYREERNCNIQQYFKDYVRGATRRNYSMNLCFDDFKAIVVQKCYYCHYKKEEEVNGIDRINNDIGYDKENCVPCCETCNMMKYYLHPKFFVELCNIISSKTIPPKEFYLNWSEYYGRSSYHNFKFYKKETESKRNIQMNITQEDWDKLTRLPCYLCGYRDAKGIGLDRVDNTKRSYDIDNIKPCCGTCNTLKKELSLDIILEKAKAISELWKDTAAFETLPRMRNPMREAKRKNEIVEKKRTQWQSKGVYYDILSNGNDFYETVKEQITEDEHKTLKSTVMFETAENALKYVKELLHTLNIRRKNK